MRTDKSPDDHGCNQWKDMEGQFINSGELYCQSIENADGVPFQLIFGPQIGEGYYPNMGSGIIDLLGIPPEDFSEKRFHKMIDKIVPLSYDVSPDLSEMQKKFMSGELKSYKADILISMPGGEKKWIQETSLPLVDDESGKVIGAFGIFFDVNDSKRNLETLEKAKEKAEGSDRLKTAFLHNVSHEIRTPLNAIIGFSSLLCENENDPVKRQEFIDIIFRSSDHLLEIVNNIVEISNIEADTVKIKKGLISLNTTMRRVYDRFRAKALDKNISLCYVEGPEDSDVSIMTDGFKFSQILTNLLDNAMKFTEKGEIEFGYSINGNKIEFYVSDTGIGIPPDLHPKIFSRFFQAENSSTRRYEGTGLGLSISKAYVELLGGEIWFTSQPGKGSVFCFTLPC
jgi:signal transduction histidine kinase